MDVKTILLASCLIVSGCATNTSQQHEPQAVEQTRLEYNLNITECENEYVVFPPGDNGRQLYGYVYVDPDAGFTINIEGIFSVDENGKYVQDKTGINKEFGAKVRITPDMKMVSRMPKGLISTLGLKPTPDWMKYYKDESDDTKHNLKWGSFYNQAGDSKGALKFLEPLHTTDPNNGQVCFELAYAYNSLERYDETISLLSNMANTEPDSVLIYKELGYAYLHKNEFSKSIATFKKAFRKSVKGKDQILCEMALQMSQAYAAEKNDRESKKWINKAKTLAPKGSAIEEYLKHF